MLLHLRWLRWATHVIASSKADTQLYMSGSSRKYEANATKAQVETFRDVPAVSPDAEHLKKVKDKRNDVCDNDRENV